MKIMNVNNNYNNKSQSPSFGMKIKMDGEAAKVLSRWTTDAEFEKLVPGIDAIKTKNGKEIVVEIFGNLKERMLNFVGFAEGEKFHNVRLSTDLNNTYRTRDFGENVIDDFMPTLEGIKKDLDFKITISEDRSRTEKYLLDKFGTKKTTGHSPIID